jgi:hypothetical protein
VAASTGQKRGQLTDRVQEKAKGLLGREISLTELRLIPYIVYTMVNDQRIDRAKINVDEREIVRRWQDEGRIEFSAPHLAVTKEFFDACNELLWLACVDLSDSLQRQFLDLNDEREDIAQRKDWDGERDIDEIGKGDAA